MWKINDKVTDRKTVLRSPSELRARSKTINMKDDKDVKDEVKES